MQVRQRLRINSAVLAISVFAVLTVLLLTTNRLTRALEAAKIADAILSASYERLLFRTDLYRTGSERAKKQLIAKHGEIGNLLKTALNKFPDLEDQKTITELLAIQESIGKLSKSLRESREKRGRQFSPDPLSLEIDDRLLSQLNMRVYESILLNGRLQASSEEAVYSALKVAGGGILLVLLIVSAVTFVNSALMNRAIAGRIGRLAAGASAIGQGNLEYRTDIKGDDEFAELSAAFDEMATKLNNSYHDLRDEVEERRRAEEKLSDAASELQTANASLADSRSAAINLMEDALAARRQAEQAAIGLRESNWELTQLNRAMVGRELRMVDLKREVDELCARAGEPARYAPDSREGQP